jgi:hypothetical protein
MTYDLRRLRLKKLIERIDHSQRYRLTEPGIKVVTFLPNSISVFFDRAWRPYAQSNSILRIWLRHSTKCPK